VERLSVIAARIERQTDRCRPALNAIGWVCFALITADYAGFIHLPAIVNVPVWLGLLLASFRWAIWEGLIKPRLHAPANPPEDATTAAVQPQDPDKPHQT